MNRIVLFRYVVIIIFLLLTAQSLFKTFFENKKYFAQSIIVPIPIPQSETRDIKISSSIMGKLSNKPKCWGASPPCFPSNYDKRIKARGINITDGFYIPN